MDVNQEYRWNNYNYNHNYNYNNNNQVGGFGSWDYGYDLPYRQVGGLIRYDCYNQTQDRDLYVAGGLYQNDVVTPALIVVPRRRRKEGIEGKKVERKEKQDWEYSYSKEGACSVLNSPTSAPPKSKPIDQDLYQIPSEFLHPKPKTKRRLGLFASCLMPCA